LAVAITIERVLSLGWTQMAASSPEALPPSSSS
jgi:hypothetical protein